MSDADDQLANLEIDGENDQLVLIVGEPATGKSASLRKLPNQERWMYLKAENKRLPFKNKFEEHNILDPYHIHDGLRHVRDNPADYDGVILDSLTFAFDKFESQYIVGAADGRTAWGAYNQWFKTTMSIIAEIEKPVIILAHVKRELNEKTGEWHTLVPVKGSLRNIGVEAFFSTIVSTKKVTLKELEKYANGMLEITPEEKELGFKYVFQTRFTKETTGERIRAPMGLFDRSETYVDNDVAKLVERLQKFYA